VLIAYLTLDEVNEDLALRLAEESGALLYAPAPRRAMPGGPFDALLYDWDSLPAERRQSVLEEVLGGWLPCPVAVHGYNMDEGLEETLSRQGVAVYRRLEPELFVQLVSSAEAPAPESAVGMGGGTPAACAEAAAAT
jgi:hypothetical protein